MSGRLRNDHHVGRRDISTERGKASNHKKVLFFFLKLLGENYEQGRWYDVARSNLEVCVYSCIR